MATPACREFGCSREHHALGWHLRDMTDFELHLLILGAPIVLKNSRQLLIINGRPMSIPSAAAKRYLESASQQLAAQWSAVFREPIPKHIALNAAIRSYLPTRRLADASNLYEAPQDAMKTHTRHCQPRCKKHGGVLVDDVSIRTHNGSDRLYDPDNPRVEVVLTPHRAINQGDGNVG